MRFTSKFTRKGCADASGEPAISLFERIGFPAKTGVSPRKSARCSRSRLANVLDAPGLWAFVAGTGAFASGCGAFASCGGHSHPARGCSLPAVGGGSAGAPVRARLWSRGARRALLIGVACGGAAAGGGPGAGRRVGPLSELAADAGSRPLPKAPSAAGHRPLASRVGFRDVGAGIPVSSQMLILGAGFGARGERTGRNRVGRRIWLLPPDFFERGRPVRASVDLRSAPRSRR